MDLAGLPGLGTTGTCSLGTFGLDSTMPWAPQGLLLLCPGPHLLARDEGARALRTSCLQLSVSQAGVCREVEDCPGVRPMCDSDSSFPGPSWELCRNHP